MLNTDNPLYCSLILMIILVIDRLVSLKAPLQPFKLCLLSFIFSSLISKSSIHVHMFVYIIKLFFTIIYMFKISFLTPCSYFFSL